jgi:hypothetical protein
MADSVTRPPDDSQPPRRTRLHKHHLWVDAQLPTDECVIWPGIIRSDGYGMHRPVYIRHRGPVPPGRVLDHRCHTFSSGCPGDKECRHRACVSPAHLEPVTNRENVMRGILARDGRVNTKNGWPIGEGRCR